MPPKFELKVECNSRMLVDQAFKIGGATVLVTPPIDDEFWLLRVPVGGDQAVVLFPKFGTYGIGFQHEKDWNTNLPSGQTSVGIYDHIKHNKQDRSIPRARCIEAIRLLQSEIVRLTGDLKYQPFSMPDGTEIPAWEARDRGFLPERRGVS